MKSEFYLPSHGGSKIRCYAWPVEGKPKAVVQIVHGIAEYCERYEDFAEYLNSQGIVVVAEDHMGHGKSIGNGPMGYFRGGWFAAVDDTYSLLEEIRKELPDVPYFLLGHSMGSFITRTILTRYPDAPIAGAILTGTGWQPKLLLQSGIAIAKLICKKAEQAPSPMLQKLMFGAYNSRIEHPRTDYDWLSRDNKIVDNYISDPKCGFIPTAGLVRDMLMGISHIQHPMVLPKMNKKLPVYFASGGEDPVGSYARGVHQTADAFRNVGMEQVSVRIFPMMRHEILNEMNRKEVYKDIHNWICKTIDKEKLV